MAEEQQLWKNTYEPDLEERLVNIVENDVKRYILLAAADPCVHGSWVGRQATVSNMGSGAPTQEASPRAP